MKKVILYSFLVMAAFCMSAGKYADQIQKLEAADVKAEVKSAVEAGDYRLVAVRQYSTTFPGLDQNIAYELGKKYGVRIIENTSDAMENPEHRRLQDAAWKYAEKYNKLLMRSIEK